MYGTVAVSGNIYVLGALVNYGKFDWYGTMYAYSMQSYLNGDTVYNGTWYSLSGTQNFHSIICSGTVFDIKVSHSKNEGTILKNPTCTESGQIQYCCTSCGTIFTESIASLEHSFGEWKTITQPTIEADGLEQRECVNCHKTESRPINKLPNPEENIKYGDVNNDDTINSSDALAVLQYTVGQITLSDDSLAASDVNKDKTINSSDALLILQYTVGQISEF